MVFIHGVVTFGPVSLRQHRVRYRPLNTHLADAALIARLAISVFRSRINAAFDSFFRRGGRSISQRQGA
jgi:hypothetical protein